MEARDEQSNGSSSVALFMYVKLFVNDHAGTPVNSWCLGIKFRIKVLAKVQVRGYMKM